MAIFFAFKSELDKLMKEQRAIAIEAKRQSISREAELCRRLERPVPDQLARDAELRAFVLAYDTLAVCTRAYALSNYKTSRKLARKTGTAIDHMSLLKIALDEAHGPAATFVADTMRRHDILRATLP